MTTEELKNKVLAGYEVTEADMHRLADEATDEELFSASHEITERLASKVFDMCSIINAKSGRCPENCKWCAQSAHHHTGVKEYGLVSDEECLHAASLNESQGVRRFSLVTSGRRPTRRETEILCDRFREIGKKCKKLKLCASLGLVNEDQLRQLHAVGVTRYHCNLEAAPSYFPQLCSTHTQEEKMETLAAARRVGMEICSGGIIGMGENRDQRIELAFALRKVGAMSIPINLLQPIKGTPLENTPALPEREVLRTIAYFRFIHPKALLRFAGGRARLSKEALEKALYVGVNSAVVGDLLTTIGSNVAEDKKRIEEAGYAL